MLCINVYKVMFWVVKTQLSVCFEMHPPPMLSECSMIHVDDVQAEISFVVGCTDFLVVA